MALRTGTGRGPGHLNRKSQGTGSSGPPAALAMKFNVATNSQYVPLISSVT